MYYPPQFENNWLKTQWAPYFKLGHWTFLLWTASQLDMPSTFWEEQQEVFAQFKAEFVKRQETENQAKRVVYHLEKWVEPFLEKLPPTEQPDIYDELGFGLEQVMTFLAPD